MSDFEIKARHVRQPTAHTCVHACLSMVTGVPVQELIERLGDCGLGTLDESTILTEMGIVPITVPHCGGHPLPYAGVYLATVPSLNLPGHSHRVVVALENDRWVVLDPNEGREGKRAYPRDALMDAERVEPFCYTEVTFLQPLPKHKGTQERIGLYALRRAATRAARQAAREATA